MANSGTALMTGTADTLIEIAPCASPIHWIMDLWDCRLLSVFPRSSSSYAFIWQVGPASSLKHLNWMSYEWDSTIQDMSWIVFCLWCLYCWTCSIIVQLVPTSVTTAPNLTVDQDLLPHMSLLCHWESTCHRSSDKAAWRALLWALCYSGVYPRSPTRLNAAECTRQRSLNNN